MNTKTLARQTAELIAAELFTRRSALGPPCKAIRLKMEFEEDQRSGIGWAEYAVAHRIEEILNRKHVRRKRALVKK